MVASDLTGHAGKIQAALVINFNHESFRGVDVQFEGINGLLPNLDLLHVVFHVTRMEGVLAKLNNQVIFLLFFCFGIEYGSMTSRKTCFWSISIFALDSERAL